MTLRRLGVRGRFLDELSFADEVSIVREIEELGFRTIWVPEALGKEAFAHAGVLLAATTKLNVATGIASIWARDPVAMVNGARTLVDASSGRFILGIGVSHAPLVESRGHRYEGVYGRLSSYLAAMADVPYRAADPAPSVPTVLGALGPRMTRLAGQHGIGIHSFFVPVEHTRRVRSQIGGPLVPQLAFSLARSRSAARRDAAGYLRRHLALENYVANLRRLGWSAADIDAGCSDALFDALVAWGGQAAVLTRVEEHIAAGADEVALHPLVGDTGPLPTMRALTCVVDALP